MRVEVITKPLFHAGRKVAVGGQFDLPEETALVFINNHRVRSAPGPAPVAEPPAEQPKKKR